MYSTLGLTERSLYLQFRNILHKQWKSSTTVDLNLPPILHNWTPITFPQRCGLWILNYEKLWRVLDHDAKRLWQGRWVWKSYKGKCLSSARMLFRTHRMPIVGFKCTRAIKKASAPFRIKEREGCMIDKVSCTLVLEIIALLSIQLWFFGAWSITVRCIKSLRRETPI